MYQRDVQVTRGKRRRRDEWPAIEVVLRRVRMNARDRGVSNEAILESAASIGNARGCTPYEVLIFWARTRQSVFPSPPSPFEDDSDLGLMAPAGSEAVTKGQQQSSN